MKKQTLVVKGEEISPETEIIWEVIENPKRPKSRAHERFEKYLGASTVGEYLELAGETHGRADFKYDLGKGFIRLEE